MLPAVPLGTAPLMGGPVPLLRDLVDEIAGAAVELRRAIHRHPEVGYAEVHTTATLVEFLEDAGLQPRVRDAGVGLTADVGEGGPLVAFRADLDGLPITELNVTPYASQNPGVMHACGHDAHAAVAAGIARVLAAHDGLPGRVRFLFQPAEETIPGGAFAMVREGAMREVAGIMAFHVDPSIPPGSVGIRADAITGASDRLNVTLTGPGGHTSRPHQTVDLVQAAARLIVDLPAHLQRTHDPRNPVVVVFGRVSGGSAENVIPTSVEVGGTVRLFDLEMWRTLPPLIERLVHEIVAPLGASAKVEYEQGSPPVVNDMALIDTITNAAVEALGADAVLPTHQSLGSEDFSWFLESAPGALVRLGSALPDRRVDLHSADFDIDERAIHTGMLVGSMALVRMLETVAAGDRAS
jgi:amidohydrolase